MRTRLPVALSALVAVAACGGGGPASLAFVEINPAQPRIGDVVTVRFVAMDSRGLPLAGQSVDFKLQSDNPAVTLSPRTATTIKGSGFAETQVVAVSHVNSVIVVATAGDKEVISPPITFAGSVPNGRQLTFQCGPIGGEASGGIHALGAYDQTRTLIAGEMVNCTAHVGDRNGDGVSGALVSFMTEAGTIGPTETSKSNAVGNATVLFKTSYPLPEDVDPGTFTWTPLADETHTGDYIAPWWMQPYEWLPNPITGAGTKGNEPHRTDPIRRDPSGNIYTNNPRDNLVAMIAVTAGEEGFDDLDNDGVFTDGKDVLNPSDDLTEPFVDSNDNGTWDPGEKYIDANNNGQWDGKNGVWDKNTLIWTTEKILWTGMPAPEDATSPEPLVRPVSPASITLTCGVPNGAECAQAGPPQQVSLIISDPWYNAIAQNGGGDGCSLGTDGSALVVADPKVFGQGVRYDYPAAPLITFTVRDARDPLASPVDVRRAHVPGYVFSVPVSCQFTASPLGGHVTILQAGTVVGTIE